MENTVSESEWMAERIAHIDIHFIENDAARRATMETIRQTINESGHAQRIEPMEIFITATSRVAKAEWANACRTYPDDQLAEAVAKAVASLIPPALGPLPSVKGR